MDCWGPLVDPLGLYYLKEAIRQIQLAGMEGSLVVEAFQLVAFLQVVLLVAYLLVAFLLEAFLHLVEYMVVILVVDKMVAIIVL